MPNHIDLIVSIISFLLSGQNSTQALSFSISDSRPTVSAGTEITIQTILTNTTNRPVTFFDTNPVCDYLSYVRDDKGQAVPRIDKAWQTECNGKRSDGRNILITLRPRESKEDEIALSVLYKLSPGKYSVQVERKLPKELGGELKSNVLSITVR